MTLRGTNNEVYVTGRELGRGGEGQVFELQQQSNLVLKKYNERLTPVQVERLRYMVSMRTPAIEAYAAWPSGLVYDDTGEVCGFVMKKLTGYAPLHMIFSPMDRKKMFPDKGYNFLVHVARNLATAFYNLHEAGLVVGDVNEGNILISSGGLVSFIDCDSFQVRGNDHYFFCEVGVPRYTPPELLNEKTFEQVVRSVNTDSFSMAVLLFQLLFLGRHPFAGKNKTAKDIDEETAIKQHEFAYSLENKRKKLHPPNDSFNITNLPEDVAALFHQAFEKEQRPAPVQWIKALDGLLGGMMTCEVSRLHTYPSQMKECPWCYFKNTRGIMYFLDDSYLHANAVFGDIENFVNGFQIDKLELKKWSGTLMFPALLPDVIDKRFYTYRSSTLLLSGGVMAIIILLVVCHIIPLSVALLMIPLPAIAFKLAPWKKKIKDELTNRTGYHKRLEDQLQVMIKEYDSPVDLAHYTKGLNGLQKMVHDFRRLPDEYERRKKMAEEKVYDEQLHHYLRLFAINDHAIPSFGNAKKATLYINGIYNAADITRINGMKIAGIGPKNQQVLLSWQRQMASGFVYVPEDYRIATELRAVDTDMEKIKLGIESAIRKEYQSLTYLKLNITNRQAILGRQVSDLAMKTWQAKLDKDGFEKQFKSSFMLI